MKPRYDITVFTRLTLELITKCKQKLYPTKPSMNTHKSSNA